MRPSPPSTPAPPPPAPTTGGGCTAFAITVGGDAATPACSTFVSLDARGGLPVAEGHVGACQRLECVHNSDLMCTADAITIGEDTASCLSYEAR